MIIPSVAVPFSKRKAVTDPKKEMLVFYEQDPLFRDFVSVMKEPIQVTLLALHPPLQVYLTTVLSQSEPTVVARKRKTNTILKPAWMQC